MVEGNRSEKQNAADYLGLKDEKSEHRAKSLYILSMRPRPGAGRENYP